ncbi:MAG TPA: alpha-hydroxy acid oxidase [Gaiellaceae bacterium]|nr:alpha-hydroxy acid oxidase [Gaiellaceae bacterium]
MEPLNVHDWERLAEERLGRGVFGYIAGGAGDEHTLRDNVAAFRRVKLRPRMLVDVSAVSTRARVLGHGVSMPLLVAPTAYHRLMHPDGEGATARGAAAAGTIFCHSTLSSLRPAELAAAAPEAARWFQLYWSRDREFTADLVAEAEANGYTALVLTVDLPVAGRRERDLREAFDLPPDLRLPNLSPRLERPLDPGAGLGPVVDESLTWHDLEWLTSRTRLPLVVKGILTAEDAVLAYEHGAAGVVVSNHGGRQLDGVPASLDALPEVVEAVGDRCEVLLDGGVRRGTDVVAALALGARAVLAGRAVLYGLGAAGEEGVRSVLDLLRAEVESALCLLGCPTPADVAPAHVRRD